MERALISGGGGFIGSHVAEFYARKGKEVIVFDNFSRARLFGQSERYSDYNWRYLQQFKNVKLIKGDIRSINQIEDACKDVDMIVHTAAQTAVTTSITDPVTDFHTNALGTFNILEVARKSENNPMIIYTSTNKVYGENVNKIRLEKDGIRYKFTDDKFEEGIPEDFPIDLCAHTPYGCSKLLGDIYVQDYSHVYGLRTFIFRMSCIYGKRQFGVEDQGFVAHFVISTVLKHPMTIYGDGLQVRDLLYIDDLVRAFDLATDLSKSGVYNIGGGVKNTASLLEIIEYLEEISGLTINLKFNNWRPYDQKVYYSNIEKAKKELGWEPEVSWKEGLKRLYDWVVENKNIII